MDNIIFQKYNYLPLELRKEVADFIEFLVQKYQQKQAIVTPPKRPFLSCTKKILLINIKH